MMDRPLWQKITIGAVLAAAALWAVYNFYFRQKIAEFNSLKAELVTCEKEIEVIRPKDIIINASLPLKEAIGRQIELISKKLPSDQDIPYVMEKFINDSSKGLKIEYNLVQPLASVAEQKYKRMPLLVSLTAGFEDLVLYIDRLQELDLIVRIDKMEIAKDKDEEVLLVNLGLSAFFLPGSSAYKKDVKPNLAQTPSFDPFFESALKSIPKSGKRSVYRKKRKAAAYVPRFKGIYKGATTKVFIDKEVVGLGDKVNGFMVSEIHDKYVVVTKNGKRYTLKLGR